MSWHFKMIYISFIGVLTVNPQQNMIRFAVSFPENCVIHWKAMRILDD